MNWVAIALVIAVAAVVVFRSARRARRATAKDPIAYRELLRLALGDREKVDRLVAFERERHPAASYARLVRQAIDRWRRDNR